MKSYDDQSSLNLGCFEAKILVPMDYERGIHRAAQLVEYCEVNVRIRGDQND